MNNEDFEVLKENIEQDFIETVSSGGDIRSFLYFPYEFLSTLVKTHLDIFLMEEAFSKIETMKWDKDFIVYSDAIITVKLDTNDKKVSLLKRLLSYYETKEHYEKCSIINNLIIIICQY